MIFRVLTILQAMETKNILLKIGEEHLILRLLHLVWGCQLFGNSIIKVGANELVPSTLNRFSKKAGSPLGIVLYVFVYLGRIEILFRFDALP